MFELNYQQDRRMCSSLCPLAIDRLASGTTGLASFSALVCPIVFGLWLAPLSGYSKVRVERLSFAISSSWNGKDFLVVVGRKALALGLEEGAWVEELFHFICLSKFLLNGHMIFLFKPDKDLPI